MSDAVQHAATINSLIFILGFLAIVIAGEYLESHTPLQRCKALFGIVFIAAIAVGLNSPATERTTADSGSQSADTRAA